MDLKDLETLLIDMKDEYCVCNNNLYSYEFFENLEYSELIDFSMNHMPSSLFKYYPNTVDPVNGFNYSYESLKKNNVYMQNPSRFDDVYDCYFNFDKEILLKYCLNDIIEFSEDDLQNDRTYLEVLNTVIDQYVQEHTDHNGFIIFDNVPYYNKNEFKDYICKLVHFNFEMSGSNMRNVSDNCEINETLKACYKLLDKRLLY